MTMNATFRMFERPAPDPWIAFLIGGFFSVLGIMLWIKRLNHTRRELHNREISFRSPAVRLRAIISATIDTDEPVYVIIKMASQSFLFLGALQLNFRLTFGIMLIFFALESSGDMLRIIIALSEGSSLSDLAVTSPALKSELRNCTVTVQPKNVYEDISRSIAVVAMVFITQAILISFVVTDIINNPVVQCPNGTGGCPVVGTLASWYFYILGIFMACVFLTGPKTSYGKSEQNPAFWLQLLLSAKHSGSIITWFDPVNNVSKKKDLKANDTGIWIRFVMSVLINGVGFHVLVHALPIQVAAQTSFLGVVFRAVGMMYLVDLDNTAGYQLTIIEKEFGKSNLDLKPGSPESNDNTIDVDNDEGDFFAQNDSNPYSANEDVHNIQVQAATDQILLDARRKLNMLASASARGDRLTAAALAAVSAPSSYSLNTGGPAGGLTSALAFAGAAGTTLGENRQMNMNNNINTNPAGVANAAATGVAASPVAASANAV